MTNCSGIGLSSPNRASNAAHTWGVAFSPYVAVHGSPGMSRTRMKMRTMIPMSTGMLESRRRTMKRVIAPQVLLSGVREGAPLARRPFQQWLL